MAIADSETMVVGIDGSEGGDEALRCAISEAVRSHRRLVVVHAWSWLSNALVPPFNAPERKKDAVSLLRRAEAAAKERGVGVEVRLVEGQPAEALVKIAQGAAMLVVGSHGYHGFAKTLLGSVSHDCIREAPCPVLVVPSHHPSEGPEQAAT